MVWGVMERLRPHTFTTLDGLRGIAALAVLQFHTWNFFGVQLFRFGYLAVDFFFMLSGFVLTFAYQNKIDSGLPAPRFLRVRFVRLYPLYFLGLLLGFSFAVLQNHYGKAHTGMGQLLQLLSVGLLVLPIPGSLRTGALAPFPFDFPTWSLFSEGLANVVHVCFFRRASRLRLFSSLGFAGACLLPLVLRAGTLNVGTRRDQVIALIPRVLFPYLLGMVLFRVWISGRVRLQIPPWTAFVAVLAVMAGPFPDRWTTVHDLFALVLILPALLLLSASSEPSQRAAPLFRMLGAISYPLYVLHAPLHDFFDQLWVRVRHHPVREDAPLPGILFLGCVIVLAFASERVYDLPVRAWLRTHFEPKNDRAPQGGLDHLLALQRSSSRMSDTAESSGAV